MLLGPEERKYSELFWRFARCGPKARPKKNFYILNFSIALSRWQKWFYYRWSGCQFGLSPPNDLLLVARFFFASSINFANIFASQHSCLLKLFAMRSRRSLDSERRQPQKILRWELFAMILFIFRGQRGALSLNSSRAFWCKTASLHSLDCGMFLQIFITFGNVSIYRSREFTLLEALEVRNI